jgi:hypothetical protein
MSRLNPEMLSVEFRSGVTIIEPIIPRRYTLTHSDITAKLYLTIGLNYANDKISSVRDEVLAEWIQKENLYFCYVYLNVDGQFNLGEASERNFIFRRELPLALEAIRYGDRKFFCYHPDLDHSSIIVFFMSKNPLFNKVENWGSFSDYDINNELNICRY